MRFLLLFVVFVTLVLNLFENSSAIETHISPASLFGDVEVMPSSEMYYLPLKEYAIDKRSIFRAFVVLKSPQNSTRARLGSLQVGYGRHVIAKYDSLVDDYVWATAIIQETPVMTFSCCLLVTISLLLPIWACALGIFLNSVSLEAISIQ